VLLAAAGVGEERERHEGAGGGNEVGDMEVEEQGGVDVRGECEVVEAGSDNPEDPGEEGDDAEAAGGFLEEVMGDGGCVTAGGSGVGLGGFGAGADEVSAGRRLIHQVVTAMGWIRLSLVKDGAEEWELDCGVLILAIWCGSGTLG
jgi:hypothetical protein